MNDRAPFTPPEITDEDIRWACGLLRLESDAFHGKDGNDQRQVVLKSMEPMDIAACPGSGKTTLLVAKLAILSEKWRYRTRGMCVLSHTNAARKEIEMKLGNTSAGRRLLSHPHFIGTIHGFVNEFLAKPWLRAKGHIIKLIDNDKVESCRRYLLKNQRRFSTLKTFVENHEQHQNNVAQWRICSPDFLVLKKDGKSVFKSDCPAAGQLKSLAKAVFRLGFHRHDEMFVWASDLMDKTPDIIGVLRDRFPLLFIDEAQDNNEDQSTILHRIFMHGGNAVRRQRFGDTNQAIFSFAEDKGANTDPFPGENVKELPNSHRFGQKIASLAAPLEIVPYVDGLIGQGPKEKRLKPGVEEGSHTIFLFDENNITKVLDAYGELLLAIFSEEELKDGSKKGRFVAIGQVHTDKDDSQMPRHVRHYWHDYDPEIGNADPKPKTFVEYVFAGMAEAEKVGQSYPAVGKIAGGILRLAGMADDGRFLHDRKYRHRYLLELLKPGTKERKCYEKILDRFVVKRDPPTEEMWHDIRRPRTVREIAEVVAERTLSGDEVKKFLEWPRDSNTPTSTTSTHKHRDNIYRYPEDNPKVHIRVGSIHSVKGQTHTATLVLETFWNDHNLKKLKPWIVRPNMENGWKKSDGPEQKTRLKIHYVAMTRPTHLLCLAMKRSNFEKDGRLDQKVMQEAEQRGWQIKCINV